MGKNKLIERAISREDQVIGNLKRQFIRHTLHGQRQISVSASTANGNIALAYHRGLAVGEQDRTKAIIQTLKKKFPAAARLVLETYGK